MGMLLCFQRFLALAAFAACSIAGAVTSRYTDAGPEPLLAEAFTSIEQNRYDEALNRIEALIKAYPNFRLAHLIRGDLLLARTKPLTAFGEGGGKAWADKIKEGDQRTPIGVYRVTSSLPKQKLSDLYGSGAFPLNYPNEWDKRMGRNGHGIWLHGTPSDTFSRPPLASDGCVMLANRDLDAISKDLQIGLTPVIISNNIEWLSLDDWQSERASLLAKINDWRSDWETRDVARYASHYSPSFTSDEQNYQQWVPQKQKVNAGKSWIKVGINNISMFRNPGKEEYVVVTFEQDYKSNNLSNRIKKRQYWIKQDGNWKILFEGAV